MTVLGGARVAQFVFTNSRCTMLSLLPSLTDADSSLTTRGPHPRKVECVIIQGEGRAGGAARMGVNCF